MEENVVPVFKLSDLTQFYKQRLGQLGVATTGHVHTSRQREATSYLLFQIFDHIIKKETSCFLLI